MTYLTSAEVAVLARVTTKTISNEVSRGHLRRVKFGRSVRFSQADVNDWLANSNRNSVQATP